MKTSVLIIGKNEDILRILVRLVNAREGFRADGSGEIEEAIGLFTSNHYDLVLLSSGIREEDERKLRSVFLALHKEVPVIQHYGGGSGLLYNELDYALDTRQNLTVLDNPFN